MTVALGGTIGGRTTLAGAMGVILILAIGLAGLRNPTDSIVWAMSALSMLALLTILVGAVVKPSPAAGWRGAAVFGWSYYFLMFNRSWDGMGPMPVSPFDPAVSALIAWHHPEFLPPTRPKLSRPDDPILANDVLSWHDLKSPGGFLALSPKDAEAWEVYTAEQEAYTARIRNGPSFVNIRHVAHTEIMMVLAAIGAVVGRVLAGPAWTSRVSTVAEPSPLASARGLDS